MLLLRADNKKPLNRANTTSANEKILHYYSALGSFCVNADLNCDDSKDNIAGSESHVISHSCVTDVYTPSDQCSSLKEPADLINRPRSGAATVAHRTCSSLQNIK